MADRTQTDLFAPRPLGPRIFTVGELTREIKSALESRYPRLAVQGEISNLSRPASGHVYFTLKDAEATLSAVLFRNQARLLRFAIESGLQVVCRGRLTLFEPRGQYQLVCDALEPTGHGALALAFEQLKARLQAEGLFEPARKRPLPLLPRHIGVVTSPSGAAVRDFLRVLHHRFPGIAVLIAPARVQGEGAAAEVAEGLRRLCAWSAATPVAEKLDVIVLTRGGGSLEDLWAFNEEKVARAIAASPIPVISAVGHEVDFSIADFVADLRCPTPTAAAERLAPERHKELEHLVTRRGRLIKAIERVHRMARHALLEHRQKLGDPRRALAHGRLALDDRSDRLEKRLRVRLQSNLTALAQVRERLSRAHPREQLRRHEREVRALGQGLARAIARRIEGDRTALDQLRERLMRLLPSERVHQERHALIELRERLKRRERVLMTARHREFDARRAQLDALSPLAVMGRGYAIVFHAGKVVRSTSGLAEGEALRLRLADGGQVDATVIALWPPAVE